MVAASHPPVNQVMTKEPGELLQMDTVGPARVRSDDGKWYVLVIVDNFSRYSWVFFMESKDEAFSHAQDLILWLQNEFLKNAMCRVHKPRVPHGLASQQRPGPADYVVNDAQLMGRPKYLNNRPEGQSTL